MSNNVRDLPRCQGTKGDGSPCERVISASQSFCYSHDARRAAERAANASHAAKSKMSTEVLAVKDRLKELAEMVVRGELTTAKGSVVAQLYGVALKALEQHRKEKEMVEVLEELDELREELGHRDNVEWGS